MPPASSPKTGQRCFRAVEARFGWLRSQRGFSPTTPETRGRRRHRETGSRDRSRFPAPPTSGRRSVNSLLRLTHPLGQPGCNAMNESNANGRISSPIVPIAITHCRSITSGSPSDRPGRPRVQCNESRFAATHTAFHRLAATQTAFHRFVARPSGCHQALHRRLSRVDRRRPTGPIIPAIETTPRASISRGAASAAMRRAGSLSRDFDLLSW